MAAYLDFDFVDAAEVVRFDDDGSFNADITNALLSEKLKDKHTAVIPGFYAPAADPISPALLLRLLSGQISMRTGQTYPDS